jgi:hypothetical protein
MLLTSVEEGYMAGYERWRCAACHTTLAYFPKSTVAPCRSPEQVWKPETECGVGYCRNRETGNEKRAAAFAKLRKPQVVVVKAAGPADIECNTVIG